MSNIFGRFATILIATLLTFILAVNVYYMITKGALTDGYYRYFGFNSILFALNDFNRIINNSGLSLQEAITTIVNIYNQNLGLFVLSAMTWFLPYIAISLVFQVGVFAYVLVSMLLGNYGFVLPHVYTL